MAHQQYFSPAETAARLGVTVRALRVYERHGLVKPLRTAAGWRAYGPDQLSRLHQTLALKGLGLPLARIGELLAGRLADLDAVFALQEQALVARRTEVERALDLLAKARRRLAQGAALSLDDLTQLTRETTMTDRQAELKDIFQPLINKHYSPEDLEVAKARRDQLRTENPALSDGDLQTVVQRAWGDLFAEAERVMAVGDTGSAEARSLLSRWNAQVEQFSGGNPMLAAKSGAIWKEALADPDIVAKLPFNAKVFGFLSEVKRRLAEQ